NKSELPIYEQIEQQMKEQILAGQIPEDEQLPSIRQLARDLRISVITTTRAYNDLAEEGFIISVAGKGYFVAPRNNELLRERMLYEMEDGLQKAVTNGRNAGLSDAEIMDALRHFLEG
ncbi:MAG: GntR family transcriptional regulator, partial [Oscillospiraceae bacterium]|nr:GntR family transcriptional regulator [Oscillospiraceae bacterium]